MRRFIAGSFGVAACLLFTADFAHAATSEERAALQAQLERIERDIANNQGSLTELQRERVTLERDIAILDNKIKNAQLQIKQSDLNLKQIGAHIADKQTSIAQVDGKVAAGLQSLAQIIRRTREMDDISFAQVALSGTLSDIFTDVDNFEMLQRELGASFTKMAALRADLAAVKRDLEEAQDAAQKVRDVRILAKKAIQKDESDKQGILSVTRGQERAYQQLISDKQKQAAAIRAALFGLRDSGAIPFGVAYEYAKAAGAQTSVRPAVILAILTEETNLGENVGSCGYRDAMNPARDVPVYLGVVQELGLDPEAMKVSCKPSYGWGGAMGPAQFIPSTWLLYRDRIASATGQNPPNPWDGRTATFAAALLMADNGADQGTRSAERTAALKYFAGANWSKRAYAFYGDDAMDIADRIQVQIDILQSS